MSDTNPYQSPEFSPPLANYRSVASPTFVSVVTSTVSVVSGQLRTFSAVLLLMCLPWEILFSYVDHFIATEADPRWTLVMIVLNPLAAILMAESIVIAATRDHLRCLGQGVVASFTRGILAYPRLLLWMIASSIVIGVGAVLCVLPGVYLNIRWMFVSAAVVFDDPPRRSPLGLSWELTQRHFAFSATLFLGFCIPMIVLILAPAAAVEVVPAIDHWLIAVAIALFDDFLLLVVTCAFACAFEQLRRAEDSAEEDVVEY